MKTQCRRLRESYEQWPSAIAPGECEISLASRHCDRSIRAVKDRRQNFQPITWFFDIFGRSRLEMAPPYQRRSVWNQRYKDEFIETVLLGYPAPAIFLYEEIEPSGVAKYSVVDGKQRLSTIFEFIDNQFSVPEKSPLENAKGKYFKDLDNAQKQAFWAYQFSVEYLPAVEEGLLNDIFNRINKNVAKLTQQELRHARFSGAFISACEALAEWMYSELGDFPRIVPQSRRQMKDVEFLAHLLLLLEHKEPRGFSQDELDTAFVDRDEGWERQAEVDTEFRSLVVFVKNVLASGDGELLKTSRLRNQVDFYSLFGALSAVAREGLLPEPAVAATRLRAFVQRIEDEVARRASEATQRYYEAARSAANDRGARKVRTDVLVVALKQA